MSTHPEQASTGGWHLMQNGADKLCRTCGEAHGFLSTGCRPRPVCKEKVGHVSGYYRGVKAMPISDQEAGYLRDQLSEIGKQPFGPDDKAFPGNPGFDQDTDE